MVMIGGIETIMYFQLKKKILPFHTKIMRDVIPESLNPGVVNAPEPYSAKRAQMDGIDLPAEDVRSAPRSSILQHPFRDA